MLTPAVDAFNVPNRVNFAGYIGNLSSPFFGKPVAASPQDGSNFHYACVSDKGGSTSTTSRRARRARMDGHENWLWKSPVDNRRDDLAPSKPNVLKQSGQATYPVCLSDDLSVKDVVEVKFKPISGKADQAGGVVWRDKDPNNYYIALCERARRQRHHRSRDQRPAHGKEASRDKGGQEWLVHLARRFPGNPLHRQI